MRPLRSLCNGYKQTVPAMLGGLLIALCVHSSVEGQSDARTEYLVRLLQSSSQFRVRAQAAISLGRPPGASDAVQALIAALADTHPAVRVAVAEALESLGDPAALDALRRSSKDREGAVRSAIRRAIVSLERVAAARVPDLPGQRPMAPGAARYYVGVGPTGSKVDAISSQTLAQARSFIVRQLATMDGVELAPVDETRPVAERVLRQRRLQGYYIDSAIVDLQQGPEGTRVVVSVLVNTYPGRDMRAMLQGSATVQGGARGAATVTQAIEGALTGALRRLPQALAAAQP